MNRNTKILLTSIIIILSAFYFWYTRKPKTSDLENQSAKDLLEISSEQRNEITIETQVMELSPIHTQIELLGETEAVPDQIMDVPARISGRVTSVYFVEGDNISKGQKLATIDSPELAKLRSNYLVANSKFHAAEQNLTRISSLVKMNLAAKQEQIDAEANLRVIESEKNSAEESLRANGLPINNVSSGQYIVYAPKSGLALSRNAIPGSIINGNQILTTIANLNDLWFQAKIYENDLQFLSEGLTANVLLNAYPDLTFQGKLEHIGEKVDPESRTVHARVVFKNQNRKAKIGLFGKAILLVNERKSFQLPDHSIQSYQNRKYIFREEKKNQYRWVEVKTGITSNQKTEILQGLKEGDRVVTKGAFELKAILFKDTFGGE
ncbi:efflux transporter, RND family, MFP subunit [Leptospira yanagawae serovar Saopaulo str. Sao Paulo = ATCC 700523]|uniref:Efflux transporter, RND family, MFP subunit n=1 Tax=Leptospira yanagawae serovar Saopaulo str. Sao Paulo = ATCC 700523 TaxID=1249483 RepID=A0A5E8HDV1_9LEPT|nr:efflux RND transporter periplasmic adaptor subunit [Leptospira yanagawae]EOQ88967.1 efflux transporter, RND family, MFP subunit [Leptospira yanagawae serovar Saopaulo str. Sao Paulo = ATCC 700523]